MINRRLLPKYVSQYKDRHGKLRLRFRKTGYPTYNFKADFGTEDFRVELRRCLDCISLKTPVTRVQIAPRSIDDLVFRYFKSGDFKRDAHPQTLNKNRAIINRFRLEHGHRSAETVTFEALDKIVNRAKEKRSDGTGGPFAAQKLRKELKRLFRFAVKLRWLDSNPVDAVDPVKAKTNGFHTWTEIDIQTFQSHWELGTTQRLAMEIMLWTAKRMGDAIKIGRHDIQNGYFVLTDAKTHKRNSIPVAPALKIAIDAMHSEHSVFIATSFGKPYSSKSFSQRFSKWCDDAGLPHCSAHGLRKAMSRRMAEARATNSQMKSITQHSGDAELAIYIKDADQKYLADKTMSELSAIYQ